MISGEKNVPEESSPKVKSREKGPSNKFNSSGSERSDQRSDNRSDHNNGKHFGYDNANGTTSRGQGTSSLGYTPPVPPGEGYLDRWEKPRVGAMEVVVDASIEKAMKVLKRKLIKEGLFREIKARQFYEKPSERKKRKKKESFKKMRKEEARMKKGFFFSS